MSLIRDYCGTDTGYKHHRTKYNEPACDWCKAAHSEAARRRRNKGRKPVSRKPPVALVGQGHRLIAAVAECGTDSGYARHLRNDEAPCGFCKDAHADTARLYRVRTRLAEKKAAEKEAAKAARREYDRLRKRDADYARDYHTARELGHPCTLRTVRVSEYLIARMWETASPDLLHQLDAELGSSAVDEAVERHPDPDHADATRAAELVQARTMTNARKVAA